jgi:hypothetical protein
MPSGALHQAQRVGACTGRVRRWRMSRIQRFIVLVLSKFVLQEFVGPLDFPKRDCIAAAIRVMN